MEGKSVLLVTETDETHTLRTSTVGNSCYNGHPVYPCILETVVGHSLCQRRRKNTPLCLFVDEMGSKHGEVCTLGTSYLYTRKPWLYLGIRTPCVPDSLLANTRCDSLRSLWNGNWELLMHVSLSPIQYTCRRLSSYRRIICDDQLGRIIQQRIGLFQLSPALIVRSNHSVGGYVVCNGLKTRARDVAYY